MHPSSWSSSAKALRAALQSDIQCGTEEGLLRAVAKAESIVTGDGIVPLLALVQSVDRDPSNSFRPFPERCTAKVLAAADDALLLLGEMAAIASARLELADWVPIDDGSCTGAIVYRNELTGEESEEPSFEGSSDAFQVLLTLPMLIHPGRHPSDGSVCWAARIIRHDRGDCSCTNSAEKVLICPRAQAGTCAHVFVIDILEVEADAPECDVVSDGSSDGSSDIPCVYTTIRELVVSGGAWRGVHDATQRDSEMNADEDAGTSLETWSDTTIVGATLLELRRQYQSEHGTRRRENRPILILGGGSGSFPSFSGKA